jgi:Fe-S-cluster containining protein
MERCILIQLPKVQADVDDTATWAKYKKKLCEHCGASCCGLPVEVKAYDLVRMRLMDEFELQENLKHIAKRLMKQRQVEHYHGKTETFTLARMANGDCSFLDSETRRCTIYDVRPDTCRNHPQIGPRSGYCAFSPKIS